MKNRNILKKFFVCSFMLISIHEAFAVTKTFSSKKLSTEIEPGSSPGLFNSHGTCYLNVALQMFYYSHIVRGRIEQLEKNQYHDPSSTEYGFIKTLANVLAEMEKKVVFMPDHELLETYDLVQMQVAMNRIYESDKEVLSLTKNQFCSQYPMEFECKNLCGRFDEEDYWSLESGGKSQLLIESVLQSLKIGDAVIWYSTATHDDRYFFQNLQVNSANDELFLIIDQNEKFTRELFNKISKDGPFIELGPDKQTWQITSLAMENTKLGVLHTYALVMRENLVDIYDDTYHGILPREELQNRRFSDKSVKQNSDYFFAVDGTIAILNLRKQK